MPSRWIRDGLLTSTAWNGLGCSQTQNFFVRLILVADDFGCFDGRDEVIASKCCPTYVHEQFVDPTIAEIMLALHRAEMIIRYSNRGRPYIAIMQWANDYRGLRKFPAPPICNELPRPTGAKPLRGAYGKPIRWGNPYGADPVSILLDLHGRPTVPQPLEWRPASHFAIVTEEGSDNGTVPASDKRVMTAGKSLQKPHSDIPVIQDISPLSLASAGGGGDEYVVTAPQSRPATTTSPPPNGEDKSEEETRWTGEGVEVPESVRLKWQGMFPKLLIPDELDHASEYLRTNDAERAAMLDAKGLEGFAFRWLLKSHNATGGS